MTRGRQQIARPEHSSHGRWTTGFIVVFIALFFGFQLLTVLDEQPLSYVDEQVHLDTALKMHKHEIPHRGSQVEMDVVLEWACGVGHQIGGMNHGCNDPALGPKDAMVGGYTTGYIHYPTYFAGAELVRRSVEVVSGPTHPVTVYRAFSSLLMAIGLVATWIVGRRLGLRGIALIAAVAIPVASSETMRSGVIINPNSAALVFGALITGTGLHWLRTGRGFGWLLAASGGAACTAVVVSIPAGAVLVAAIIAWVAGRRGWRLAGGARPRLVHIVSLMVVLVTPILAWSQYISLTSTASNEEIYGGFGVSSWSNLVSGALAELTLLHSPWSESEHALVGGTSWLSRTARGAATGMPVWITVLVLGALVLTCFMSRTRRGVDDTVATEDGESVERAEGRRATIIVDPTVLLAVSACVGLVLYPVALRLSNALTFGIDVSITPRYSMGFAPMLTLLAFLLVKHRRYAALLLGVGVATTAALSLSWM